MHIPTSHPSAKVLQLEVASGVHELESFSEICQGACLFFFWEKELPKQRLNRFEVLRGEGGEVRCTAAGQQVTAQRRKLHRPLQNSLDGPHHIFTVVLGDLSSSDCSVGLLRRACV